MSEFVSGWVGGCCGLFIGHPFDTLKVKQQNSASVAGISTTVRNCVNQVTTTTTGACREWFCYHYDLQKHENNNEDIHQLT